MTSWQEMVQEVMESGVEGNEEYELEDVEVEAETPKAWLVKLEPAFKKWFPKSRCELTPNGTLSIPGWLLEKIVEEL